MADSHQWFAVARADDLPPGAGRTVVADGRRVALFNDGGTFLALDDLCPHRGGPLGEGTLHDGRVICPWHSWVFDLRTGRCPRDSHEPVAVYSTRRAGDAVEVRLPVDRALAAGQESDT